MEVNNAIKIRSRKLAILLFDARQFSRRSVEECADAIGISPAKYNQFENGKASPSLPELEIFANFLKIPLLQFWSDQTLLDSSGDNENDKNNSLLGLRTRIIAIKLKKARVDQNISVSELAKLTNLPDLELTAYESGKTPVPLPVLEILATFLDTNISQFFDDRGEIGSWQNQVDMDKALSDLPGEMLDFLSKPVNRPYLELAKRLSELSSDKLRSVAEGLLEITL
ncbi:MAG: helix-turn-helix transcriptional regulator [Anaerolineaceae bacterium]|nr:helix-turn-helix transcriptional regulator [Anaerolineaceae bacterium]